MHFCAVDVSFLWFFQGYREPSNSPPPIALQEFEVAAPQLNVTMLEPFVSQYLDRIKDFVSNNKHKNSMKSLGSWIFVDLILQVESFSTSTSIKDPKFLNVMTRTNNLLN